MPECNHKTYEQILCDCTNPCSPSTYNYPPVESTTSTMWENGETNYAILQRQPTCADLDADYFSRLNVRQHQSPPPAEAPARRVPDGEYRHKRSGTSVALVSCQSPTAYCKKTPTTCFHEKLDWPTALPTSNPLQAPSINQDLINGGSFDINGRTNHYRRRFS